MSFRLWEIKWGYTDPETKKRKVQKDLASGKTEEDALLKAGRYKQLYEMSIGAKLTTFLWKEIFFEDKSSMPNMQDANNKQESL